jgi:hypothetical protein
MDVIRMHYINLIDKSDNPRFDVIFNEVCVTPAMFASSSMPSPGNHPTPIDAYP